MADQKKGLLERARDTVKEGLDNVGEALKNNPITGTIYAAGKGLGTMWEKGKTKAFKADIHHMIEEMKTKIIDFFKKITDALNKEAQDSGKKIIEGEFREVPEKKELMNNGSKIADKEGLNKEASKEVEKNLEKGLGKEKGMMRTSDLSKTLESAGAKAAPGLEVAGGAPNIQNPGLDIGKGR